MLKDLLERLPEQSSGAVVVLSGGMDSTIALRLAIERYGKDKVAALTFSYGQRQSVEIEFAKDSTKFLGVEHFLAELSVLGMLGKGFSANCDTDMKMPTIKEVLGNPRPPTYVPNRNMILMAIAAAYAEPRGLDSIICGLQVHDSYGYHDATQAWVDDLNTLLAHNRISKIKVHAPFSDVSKTDEIKALQELDVNLDLLEHTLTCYNPGIMPHELKTRSGQTFGACGKCPTCAERIQAFKNLGLVDPCPYLIPIKWG